MLDGKAILITGASSGIGAEAARVFAREGAAIVLGARSQDRLAELCDELPGGGADATHLAGDISSTCDVQRLIDAVLQIPVGVACYLWWRRSQRRAQPVTAGIPQLATPKAGGAASTDQPGTQARHRQPPP